MVYNTGAAALQDRCAYSTILPEDNYTINYIDLTTGKQASESLAFDNDTFNVSNSNFRVNNVGGKPVVSGVQLMTYDLTVTYKHSKLAFSTFDMSTTVHMVQ